MVVMLSNVRSCCTCTCAAKKSLSGILVCCAYQLQQLKFPPMLYSIGNRTRQGLHGERGWQFPVEGENGEQHNWMRCLDLFGGRSLRSLLRLLRVWYFHSRVSFKRVVAKLSKLQAVPVILNASTEQRIKAYLTASVPRSQHDIAETKDI